MSLTGTPVFLWHSNWDWGFYLNFALVVWTFCSTLALLNWSYPWRFPKGWAQSWKRFPGSGECGERNGSGSKCWSLSSALPQSWCLQCGFSFHKQSNFFKQSHLLTRTVTLTRWVFILCIKNNLLVKLHLDKLFCSTVKQLMVPCSTLPSPAVALDACREGWRQCSAVPAGWVLSDASSREGPWQ